MSHITRDEAVSEALKSGVVILAVDTNMPKRLNSGARGLNDMARASGGLFFVGIASKDISRTFLQIQEIIEGIYFATYIPPASGKGIHEVEVRPAGKEKLDISYPAKYLWPQ